MYQTDSPQRRELTGKVDRIGSLGTTMTFSDPVRKAQESRVLGQLDHGSAARFLIDWLEEQMGLASLFAVGHRIVNGGANRREPQRVTSELLDELRRISVYAPEHLAIRD